MEFFISAISGVIGVVFFIVWLVLLVYALWLLLKSRSTNLGAKLLWLFIIVLAPILGSLLYLFWSRTQNFV
jgi:Zn-dependent protease with chaperone function